MSGCRNETKAKRKCRKDFEGDQNAKEAGEEECQDLYVKHFWRKK